MKYLFLFISIFLNLSLSNFKTEKIQIDQNSSIIIYGKSNINRFSCKYNMNLLQKDYEISAIKKSSRIDLIDATLKLNSSGFDCFNKMITNDLKKTIKADKHQFIIIHINQINKEQNQNYTVDITVEITGITKKYIIPIEIFNNQVNGTLKLNIKDFKLVKPKKALGIIQLNDEIDIVFNLTLNYN